MIHPYLEVAEFHKKFGLPVARSAGGDRPPALPDRAALRYRLDFLAEELAELEAACRVGDLAAAADAIADLVWVAYGTAHYFGLPMEAVWAEVRRANMEKVLGPASDATHKRGAGETVRKPAGWRAPDLDAVLQTEAEWYGDSK